MVMNYQERRSLTILSHSTNIHAPSSEFPFMKSSLNTSPDSRSLKPTNESAGKASLCVGDVTSSHVTFSFPNLNLEGKFAPGRVSVFPLNLAGKLNLCVGHVTSNHVTSFFFTLNLAEKFVAGHVPISPLNIAGKLI